MGQRGRTAGYKHTQRARDSIQASQLVNRLEANAMGTFERTPDIAEWAERNKDNISDEAMEELKKLLKKRNREPMTASQVKSAEVLLNKTLPSLQSVDQTVINEQAATPEEMTTDQLNERLAELQEARKAASH